MGPRDLRNRQCRLDQNMSTQACGAQRLWYLVVASVIMYTSLALASLSLFALPIDLPFSIPHTKKPINVKAVSFYLDGIPLDKSLATSDP